MVTRALPARLFAPDGGAEGGATTTADVQDTTVVAPPAGEQGDATTTGQDPEKFDAAYVANLRKEAADYRKKLRDAETKVSTFESEKLTESEKLVKRAEEAEAERDRLRRETMVAKVARKHNLPDELADRLRGDDEAAMEADAKALARLIPATGAGSGGGATNPPRGAASTLTMDAIRTMTRDQIEARYDEVMKVINAQGK